MSSLFITRQNVPSFKEWRAGGAVGQAKAVGAVMGAWIPDALNNQSAVKAFLKVPADARAGFLSGGGVGTPGGTPVQFEEHVIDAELGLGGDSKIAGAAMLRVNLTLACSYDDFKVHFIESIANMYPGLCKAFLCKLPEKNGEERATYVVFFDAAALGDVKREHDLTKPTAFRRLLEDAVVKEVEPFEVEVPTDVIGYGSSEIQKMMPPPKLSRMEWVPEVALAFDAANKGGEQYKLEVWGRMNGELLAKLAAACEYLAVHQHSFSYTLERVIEADLEQLILDKCRGLLGKAKDHVRMFPGGPLVMLNGKYLGSSPQFEAWALATYGYKDKTLDALYHARARKSLAAYMEREKDVKDFVYLDMAYINAAGTHEAIKPRIVIELYKQVLPTPPSTPHLLKLNSLCKLLEIREPRTVCQKFLRK